MEINSGLANITIKHCIFRNTISRVIEINNDFQQIGYFKSLYHRQLELPTVLISNTTFKDITFFCEEQLVQLQGTVLQLEGPVVFANFPI